jgi:heptosyltransferase-2
MVITQKSLIVKLGAIGDVAMVLPAAWKLYQSGSEIDWLCGKTVAPLLSCYEWVRPIVVDDARLLKGDYFQKISEMLRTWRALFGSSYDLCASLQYDRRFKILTLPVRAKRSIALSLVDRTFKLVSERHYTAEYTRILCGLNDGYREENFAPLPPCRLPENPLPRGGQMRIALVPGGARNLLREDSQRRWPLGSYVALTRILLNQGYEVVLTGGPGDEWVKPDFEGLPVQNQIGQWTIPQTLAFYQSCDYVVTHDTGPLHLAGLAGCGLVGLFGPTSPSKFLPRRNGVIALWGGERLPCRPCYDGREFAPCPSNCCISSITPLRVMAAVETLRSNPDAEWQVVHL